VALAEDYDLWIRTRLDSFNQFASLRETLLDYRVAAPA
jgi:hypothetical protein